VKQASQTTGTEDQEAEAARRLAGALDPSMIDALLADAKISGTPIDGVDGLLNRMTKAVIERALQAEMTHELGYARDDPAGAGSGNSRNGSARKTISTANGRSRLMCRATGTARSSRRSCRNEHGGSGRSTR